MVAKKPVIFNENIGKVMSKKIKIAFLCSVPPTDKKVWSGTIYSMYQTFLDNGFEVEWIPVNKFLPWQNSLFSAIEKFYKKIFNRGFNSHHFIAKSIIASRILDKNIQKSDADVIFAPTTIAELAFLKSKKPVLYLNDATFHQLINYYGAMSGFGLASKKITEFIEKKALQRADALV